MCPSSPPEASWIPEETAGLVELLVVAAAAQQQVPADCSNSFTIPRLHSIEYLCTPSI